jgi:hypothetical protein
MWQLIRLGAKQAEPWIIANNLRTKPSFLMPTFFQIWESRVLLQIMGQPGPLTITTNCFGFYLLLGLYPPILRATWPIRVFFYDILKIDIKFCNHSNHFHFISAIEILIFIKFISKLISNSFDMSWFPWPMFMNTGLTVLKSVDEISNFS